MRVAIYARASTEDKGQDPENQLVHLRAWCVSAGHTIVREYVDQESGRSAKRKPFAQLFEDAHRRQFDCVLFWALEPHLATDNELVRNILLALLASLAKLEAQKISERTKAGLASARAKGKRLGRPRCGPELRARSGCAGCPGQGHGHSADGADRRVWGRDGAADQGRARIKALAIRFAKSPRFTAGGFLFGQPSCGTHRILAQIISIPRNIAIAINAAASWKKYLTPYTSFFFIDTFPRSIRAYINRTLTVCIDNHLLTLMISLPSPSIR